LRVTIMTMSNECVPNKKILSWAWLEVGLMPHALLGINAGRRRWVGSGRATRDTHTDSETERELPQILIHQFSSRAAESHCPFLICLVYSILCLTAYL
jgi:hypothetical protein